MALSDYHQKYLSRTKDEIVEMIAVKERMLRAAIDGSHYAPTSSPVKVAVIGCASPDFIPAHKKIFEDILGVPISLTTFDISIEHLQGGENVIQHDCTEPLPGVPYDITYSDILLKFIETDKQWNVLENSVSALRKGGIAIHFIGNEEGNAIDVKLGYNDVPFSRWREELKRREVAFHELSVETGYKNTKELIWILSRGENS